MDLPRSAASLKRCWDTGSQLKDHIYNRSRVFFEQGDRDRDAIVDAAELAKRQGRLRTDVLDSIGGLPSSETALNAKVTGTVDFPGGQIELVIFESRPSHYVTANLYLPKDLRGTGPAILFLCGHATEGKQHPPYQVVCQILANAGFIVFAIDPIGQGERFSYFDPASGTPSIAPCTADHNQSGAVALLTGQHLARYMLHDAMRSIDYLLTRREVDGTRLGVTGNSGGGAQASLLMMVDRRLAAAAPGTFITSRRNYQDAGGAQDAEQIWPEFTSRGYDHEDVLLAMAPRPVCVLAVTSDFFPIEGTRRTVERARRIWEMLGRAESLELVEDDSRHAYTPNLARACAAFFSRHLTRREIDVLPLEGTPAPPGALLCTKSGQVSGDFPDARFVFDETLEKARFLKTCRKRNALAWWNDKVQRGRNECPLNPRFLAEEAVAGTGLVAEAACWWPQPDLLNNGFLLRLAKHAGETLPVTIAIWKNGTEALEAHREWISRECAGRRAVLVLDLCGFGPLRPHAVAPSPLDEFNGTFHKLNDDLVWIGDTLLALRTYETLRALQLPRLWPRVTAEGAKLHGHGRVGACAPLAGALSATPWVWDESFSYEELITDRNYDSVDMKAIQVPEILRYFDLDEL